MPPGKGWPPTGSDRTALWDIEHLLRWPGNHRIMSRTNILLDCRMGKLNRFFHNTRTDSRRVIEGRRHYLLTLMDCFCRYFVAWGVVKTVTQREVKNLVALGMMSQEIDGKAGGPELRADASSPNMAGTVRSFLNEVGV